MKTSLKLSILVTTFLIQNAISSPIDTSTQSLVISSTISTPTSTSTDGKIAEKEQSQTPTIPKIYEMQVQTNVSNRFAKTAIESKVKNSAIKSQEATFSVVLPETGYITGFTLTIDGKSYEAYVKEKEEAKQIYDQAVQSGQTAAHVGTARDSNRFTVSLNVEPQSKVNFRLTYEELLKRQNEQYEIVININPGQPVKQLAVQVQINETQPLKFVRTPSLRSGNEIGKNSDELNPHSQITTEANSAHVRFDPNLEQQKHFAANLGTKEENGLSGQFVVQYDVERAKEGGEILVNDGHFVHFFAPDDLPSLVKQVVFVLDTSGSMEGRRVQQLKEAMNSIVAELKDEDLVNIVEFSSTVRVWNIEDVKPEYENHNEPWAHHNNGGVSQNLSTVLPLAYKATAPNREKARQVVQKLEAYGGTDILSALEVGLQLVRKQQAEKPSNHQPMIIFLTDGEATVGETNQNTILNKLKELQAHPKIPIFSLSFGDGADRDFVQKLSLNNVALSRHIYEAADASLQLQGFYKQISSPVLANVAFKYVNEEQVTKRQFPIYFHGSEIVVAGKVDGEFSDRVVTVSGNGLNGSLIEFIPKVERQPAGNLERLWAYLTVRQVLEARDAADNKTALTQKALELALKYSFVTAVSSLVVVKPNDTRAQNTEDASTANNDRPYFLQKNYLAASASFGGMPIRTSAFSSPPLQQSLYANHPFIPQRTNSLKLMSARRYYINRGGLAGAGAGYPLLSTTIRQSLEPATFETSEADSIQESSLPWLNALLSENNTIALNEGNYTLYLENEPQTTKAPCPKLPGNDTISGECIYLKDCPQVHQFLTDLTVFQKYFCPINSFVGVCCPIKEELP